MFRGIICNAKMYCLQIQSCFSSSSRLYQQCIVKSRAVPALIYRSFYSAGWVNQIYKDTVPSLSPHDVTTILRKNEFCKEFPSGNSVKSYDCNQLASNDPIEDTRCEATCKLTSGLLFGVFDGHGGPACAQAVSKRLFQYIAATLLPYEKLKKYISERPRPPLLDTFNDMTQVIEEIKVLHERSFSQYLTELDTKQIENPDIASSLENAILKLDDDIAREAIEQLKIDSKVSRSSLAVALSGAVACVAHIDGPNLYVANVGDSNAVLGTFEDDEHWIAKQITKEHNTENINEVKRIWSEHPVQEKKSVLRGDRLLGELAPLRSLGDFRYKWPAEYLMSVSPALGHSAVPSNYHTPPYLTARPELHYERLTHKDKFMILASDGLWDMITPLQAVKLVGEHMKGKLIFNPLTLPGKNITLGDISEMLMQRKENLKSKPKDRNAATHLIRHAIGGTEYGLEHIRVVQLLSLDPKKARSYRDDMTVTVIYFDTEYISHCPN